MADKRMPVWQFNERQQEKLIHFLLEWCFDRFGDQSDDPEEIVVASVHRAARAFNDLGKWSSALGQHGRLVLSPEDTHAIAELVIEQIRGVIA